MHSSRPGLCGTPAGIALHRRRAKPSRPFKLCPTCRLFAAEYEVKRLEVKLAEQRKQIRQLKTQLSALLRGNYLSVEPAKVTIPAELFAMMYLTCDLDVAINAENEVGREFVEEAITIADQKGHQ